MLAAKNPEAQSEGNVRSGGDYLMGAAAILGDDISPTWVADADLLALEVLEVSGQVRTSSSRQTVAQILAWETHEHWMFIFGFHAATCANVMPAFLAVLKQVSPSWTV